MDKQAPTETTPPVTVREPGPGEDRDELVRLLYGDAAASARRPEEYEARYPRRALPKGAMVTRFAPSPTGFMHIGGIFVSLINKRLSVQSEGVFFLRIEDTDVKRAIPGALDTIVDSLARYDLSPQEGVLRAPAKEADGPSPRGEFVQQGDYGPYIQTERVAIYRDYAIDLIRRGFAYPCFCTVEELDAIRQEQEALQKKAVQEQKALQEKGGQELRAVAIKTGYYGRWAKWRDAPLARVKEALASGTPFVLRLRAPDDVSGRVEWKDGVKGVISMPVNDLDTILLKSDGIPTYHFAHAVDDHLMRTTHVIRGDEWISSMPLHLQLFRVLGFRPVEYAHVPPIQKLDRVEEADPETGETKVSDARRKLSKRKDPEANIEYYREIGVPETATIEYLLNIANSAFEDWRKANPDKPYTAFPLKLNKLAPGGALSDLVKLKSVSQAVVSRMSAEDVYTQGLDWARTYDRELAALMERDPEYTKRALGIERGGKKSNKRIVTWPDLRPQLFFFYDELYSGLDSFDFPENVPEEDRKPLLRQMLDVFDPADSKEAWFEKIRQIAVASGYAGEVKQYKAAPESWKGHVGDVSMVVRVAVCGTRNSPDLTEVMAVLGEPRVRARIARFL
ncbi:glutamate--tRNA ligase [Sorangium sp. So ce388]|uniref:glutamate--tRNA ligase n=1 Tax=Sorangium sp. So ce388 TaxID=3133309 RepID=UPI003F5C5309